ncbi:hypothetical protein QKW35_17625 [Pontibacterium granulatum]|uniref:hypothetical protein n=1 Tax=Pontibacterium granulatum TaxID=2036029 RepID=UPI00249C1155|nr:hypothetical protein [Pontibacterium granulatum]MDI3326204.1 hypothetical protein [Pontibacterium granulatum]
MDKALVLRIREQNQDALKYLETVDYFDMEVFGRFTYHFSCGVYRIANRLNDKRRRIYLEDMLRAIAGSGGKPLHDADICDAGLIKDFRGCAFGWVIRPMNKDLEEPSEHPFDPDLTTVTVHIMDEKEWMEWGIDNHWLSNKNAKARRGHYPF